MCIFFLLIMHYAYSMIIYRRTEIINTNVLVFFMLSMSLMIYKQLIFFV